MRVVVVGAGVLGASTAWHLAKVGVEVRVLEAVAPGAGTSSRGAGLVSEGGWHATSIRLVRRSIDLLVAQSAEAAASGSPFRFEPTGSTTLVPDRFVQGARGLARLQRGLGVDVREVAPADVPALPRHAGIEVGDVAAAFHYPRDGWARPRSWCEMLSRDVSVERAAAQLAIEDGRAVVRVDGERAAGRADAVVLAAGVHTRALLRGAGLDAPLLAYRTQAIDITHPRAHETPILHDAAQGFYCRPGQATHMLAGNGTTTTPEDPTRWRAEADAGFVARSLARVRHRFPFLSDCAPGEAHAGIDVATPDRLMLAGRHPGAEGLWLAVGGNGHGFMRAPALGESLAALIAGRSPPVALDAYDPGRFASADDFAIREGYSLEATEFK